MCSGGTTTDGSFRGVSSRKAHNAGHPSLSLFLIGITLSVEFIGPAASSQVIMSHVLAAFQGPSIQLIF
jgi:hypothetical protein